MEEKNKGLYGRYIIQKADGSPVNPDAKYFVLRYDEGGDEAHVKACRAALAIYAAIIEDDLPELAKDLKAELKEFRFDDDEVNLGPSAN